MRLSKSKSVLDQAEFFTVVRDARVTLYEDGREVARLSDQGEGRYLADFQPSIGRSTPYRQPLRASAGRGPQLHSGTDRY